MERTQFDKMYDSSPEDIDMALKEKNRERVRKSWKRDFEKRYDDFSEKIDEAEHEIMVMDQDMTKYDLNKKLTLFNTIEQYEEIKEQIRIEYEKMFGVDMKV